MDAVTSIVAHPFAMLMYGVATHFLKKLMQHRMETGGDGMAHPIHYFKGHPYQSLLSIVGALAGYAALSGSGELTLLTAYGMGYMADSAADTIGGRTMKKI